MHVVTQSLPLIAIMIAAALSLVPSVSRTATEIDWNNKRDAARTHAVAIKQAWGRLSSWIERRPRGADPDLTQIRSPHVWLSGPMSRGIRAGETFEVITVGVIEAGEPVVLPWMPKKWKDFTFRSDGTVLASRADGSPDRIATWIWTKGRLWVQIDGNREAPDWEDVAKHLGMARPKLWTPADGQRIGPVARGAAVQTATSGTARCIGDHEGTATWTLDASGAKVWDSSGCRKKAQ